MNVAKFIAFILCAIFLIATPVGSEIHREEDVSVQGINTAAAMTAFKPGTVMLSSGDFTVTWGEMYVSLHDIVSQITGGFQENPDWQQIYYSDTTLAEEVKSFVIDQCIQTLVFQYGASALDVSLSEGTPEDIQTLIDSLMLEAGDLKTLEKDLRGDGFVNLRVFEDWLKLRSLQERILIELYGETYTDLPDEIVASFAEREGFMRAKHILRVFPTELDGFSPDEIEDAKKEALDKLEGILNELNGHKGDDDFFEVFDMLMAEHSEDPGSTGSPDGYLFQSYDMVEPFSTATDALEPGQMSGIVETPYGYHVILRLPLDYDMIPISVMNSGESYTLRQLAIFDDFDAMYSMWLDSMIVERSPELDSLDVAKLFEWYE